MSNSIKYNIIYNQFTGKGNLVKNSEKILKFHIKVGYIIHNDTKVLDCIIYRAGYGVSKQFFPIEKYGELENCSKVVKDYFLNSSENLNSENWRDYCETDEDEE
jgi:hypothetical protein